MQSRFVARDAENLVESLAEAGVPRDLALRIYTTCLLGQEPKLVLHGGGNTSLKTRAVDLLGEETDVLCVKASGRDMGRIDPSGLPAVRLAPVRSLRGRAALDDGDMLRLVRANLLDPMAPDPSVEILLHAFLTAKYVDHTHATAVLALTDQPNGESICAQVFAGLMGFVPYVRSGLALAKAAAEVFDRDPRVCGLVLHKHGLVTVGENAREAYERMIEMVSLAEARLQHGRKSVFAAAHLPPKLMPVAEVAPIVRGACSLKDPHQDGAFRRLVLAFRNGESVLNFVSGVEIDRYARTGVVTPDHTIRTKNWPLILDAPADDRAAEFRQAVRAAATSYVTTYKTYFDRNNVRCGGGKVMLDPLPRVVLVPGLGLFGLGRSKRDAVVAADLAEAAIETVTGAEAIGRFESISEAEMFDVEYWSLEQAKLGARQEPPLAGQIAAITGAAGAIGFATAQAFAAAGAEIALLDVDAAAAREKSQAIPGAVALACDVTDAASVRAAFDRVVEAFGGVDIVVSNAGAAWQGRIGEVDEAILRASFELNFYGHQRVAQAAVKIMRAQGTGGCLLFNVSKQAVNPGPNFGPYGLPKAATLFLVRQYALDYGADGIRANAVNADRVRSGLLTDDMIAARAEARGLSVQEYMGGNLLQREVTAEDVAQAFLAQALALKTTADVTTVDGGNIAAALR